MESDKTSPTESPTAATERLATDAVAGIHGAVDKAAASMGSAALSTLPAIEVAAQTVHKGVDRLADAVAPPADWVRRHPLESLGIAFAAGFLLGRLGR